MKTFQRWSDLWAYWGQATGILPPVRELAKLLYESQSFDAPEDDPTKLRLTLDLDEDQRRVREFLLKHKDVLQRAVLAVMISARALPKDWSQLLELPEVDVTNRLEYSLPLETIAESIADLATRKLFLQSLDRGEFSPFLMTNVDALAVDIQAAISSALSERYGLLTNIEDIYAYIRQSAGNLVSNWAKALPALDSRSWYTGPWKAPNIHTLDYYDLRQFLGDMIEKHWTYVQAALRENKVSDPFALRRAVEAAQRGDAEGYLDLIGFIFTDLGKEVNKAWEKEVAEARAQNKEPPPHPAERTARALAEFSWRLAPLDYLFFPFTGPVTQQIIISEFYAWKLSAYDVEQLRQLLSPTMTVPGSKGLVVLNPFMLMEHKNVSMGEAPMEALVRSGLLPRILPYMTERIKQAIMRDGVSFGVASIYAAAWDAFQDYVKDLVVNRYVMKQGSLESLALTDPTLVRLRLTPEGIAADIRASAVVWRDDFTGTKIPIVAQHGNTILEPVLVREGPEHYFRIMIPANAAPGEISLKFMTINPDFDELDLAFYETVRSSLTDSNTEFSAVFAEARDAFPEHSSLRRKLLASEGPLQGLWVLLQLAPVSIWRKPGCNPIPDYIPPELREHLTPEEIYELKLERDAFHRFIYQDKQESLKLWEELMVRLLQPWIPYQIVEEAARETPMGYSIWDTLLAKGFEDDLRVVLKFVETWANKLPWQTTSGQPNPLTSNYIKGWIEAVAKAIQAYQEAMRMREELADETMARMILSEIYARGESPTLKAYLSVQEEQPAAETPAP